MRKFKYIFFFFYCILFNILSFAQPSNDDCANPTQIIPSPSCDKTATTLAKATAKAPFTNPDVWYSFVATSTTHSIGVVTTKILDPTNEPTLKPIIELFENKCNAVILPSQPIDGSTQTNQSNKQERTYVGLHIGQTYYYRVYNKSTGTLFDFDTYVCETINSGVVNDEISNAIDLTVNSVCNLKTYSITGATLNSDSKKIIGSPDHQYSDVWFKVTVPKNGSISVILQSLGIRGEYGIALYRGTNYNNLTELSSDIFEQEHTLISLFKSGLIPDEVLYIRICIFSKTTTLGAYKICASTPPSCGSHTPAGDNCSNPTRICDLNGYCGNTSRSYTIDEPSNLKAVLSNYQSNISIENNSWLSFIANATSATFTIYVSNCVKIGGASTATGIQLAILEATNCSNFITKSSFFSPGEADNGMITATNLTIGKEYLIMIDGADGANCDYTIATNSGVLTIDAGPDQIYCNPATIPLNLNATGVGASSITWDARVNNTLNTNIASSASATINPGPTQNTTYIVKASGTCAGAIDSLNVTIQNCICVKPTINTQPQNQIACSGNNVNFTFTSNGITYQWKDSRDNGASFSPLTDGGLYAGTKTTTLSINGVTSAYNGYLYKCIILDATGKCSDSTTIVSITMTPLTTINSSKIDFCKGNSITLSAVSNPPANYSFVWKVPTGVADPGNVNSFSTTKPGTYTVNVFAPNNLLCNSDFEDNQVTTTGQFSWVDKSQISCWNTTARENQIEVWNNGFQSVPSFSGKQFIELNAKEAATLYQDISVIPGGLITLSFAHRGRYGTDKMEIKIGPINGPFTSLGIFADNNTAWGFHTVNYTVPSNSPITLRLQFIPVYSSNNDLTIGNFLDAISIKTTSCSILSNEFILTEKPLPTAQITGEAKVCKDDTQPTLTFTGNDGTAPYVFTYSLNNGANQTITSIGNTATLNIPTNSTGRFSYQLISAKEGSSFGCSQNQTGTKIFQVIANSDGGTLSDNQTICSGNAPMSLNLTRYVGSITKWQSSEAPYNTWTDIPHTTSSYSPGKLTKSTKFRVEVKNDICSPVFSNEITISVDEIAVGGTVSSDQSICETVVPDALNLNGHSGQISKWQFSVSPFTTWLDLTNNTTTYSPAKLTQSTRFRAIVKSGVCPEKISNESTITVKTAEHLGLSCGISTSNSVQFIWTDISDETKYNYSYTIIGGSSGSGQLEKNTSSVSIPVSSGGQNVNLTLEPIEASCTQTENMSCISQTCLTPVTKQIDDDTVCAGEDVTIPPFSSEDNPTSYIWSVNYDGLLNNNSGDNNIPRFKSPMTLNKITAVFSVNAIKAGCVGPTMTFKVIINPLPVLNIVNNGPICRGSNPIQLSENSGNGSSWSWKTKNNTGSFSSTTNQHPTIDNPDNGEIVTVIVKDNNKCIDSATTTLIVNPLPIINAGEDQTTCSGNPVTLKATGALSYTWDNSIIDSVAFRPIVSTRYTVTGTDNNGCKNTDQVNVIVNLTPDIKDVNLSICSGQSFTINPLNNINGQIVPIGTKYTWTVSTNSRITGASNQLDKQNDISSRLWNNNNTSEIISYLVKASHGDCYSFFNINVTVHPLPNFTPSARSKCVNEALYVKANTGSISNLIWKGPNGFFKTQDNDNEILITTNAQSNIHGGEYCVTVTDVNGCIDSSKLTVAINPLPIIYAGEDLSVCKYEYITLKGRGGLNYTWNNEVIDSISFSPHSTKTYEVTGTDAKGCKNTDEVVVTVNPLPEFSLSVNDPCEQAILEFSVDLTNNPSTAGVFSSNWNGPNGFSASSLNPTISNVTADATGVYNLTITDNNQCARTKSINALINLVDNIQFADIPPKCINGDPFPLPIPNIIGGSWSSDDNTSIQNPLTGLFEPKKSKPDQEYKVVVTYSTKSIIPARKCPATLSKVVFVNPIPDSTFYAKNPVLCIDDTLHLVINQPNKNVNYTWDLGNGTLIKQNTQNLDYNYPKDGDFTIKLIAELGNCKVSETKQAYVHVIPKPTLVDFTQSETEIDFYNPEIQFKSYTNGKYLFWNFGDGTYSNYKNPTHKFPENPGEYIIDLTASNMENNACRKTVTRSIFMPEPVIYFIPNTFTPNGDELNNVFQPVFTFGYDPQNYGFYIYDRWGELLFETHDTKIGWDGTYGNQIVQNDTYIWKLEFKEKLKEDKHSKVGHVDLLR